MDARKRHRADRPPGPPQASPKAPEAPEPLEHPSEMVELLVAESPEGETSRGGRSQWLFLAVASGACAAFNGVFAKLTTTELTSTLSGSIAGLLGISAHESAVEVIVRGVFFVLNLAFNGIMWMLFTKALARGKSATQVAIMNASANFLVTAFMGMLVFSEALPPSWWAGASLLVAGSVIAGRADEGENATAAAGAHSPVPDQEPEEDAGGSTDGQDRVCLI